MKTVFKQIAEDKTKAIPKAKVYFLHGRIYLQRKPDPDDQDVSDSDTSCASPLVNSSSDEGEGNSFMPTETTDNESDDEEFGFHAAQGGSAKAAAEALRCWNECV